MDFVLQKPPTLRGYALHRMAAGIARGAKVLFADCGDHLLLRSPAPLEAMPRPLREIHVGDIVGFELRACVSRKVKGRHRYYPTADWHSRHEWLSQQGDKHGFAIITVHCSATMHTVSAGERSFTIDQTDFTGVLKVTDEQRFTQALENGIGNTARAFGFGMLII